MTRGFITIATGSDTYFQLAKNLLLSYRLFCDDPMPFAILCDKENECTALFDKVILFQKNEHAYFDKFELLKLSPYDEAIFVDADCLAYADLNEFWDYFGDAADFAAAGTNYPIDSDLGLFQKEEINEYADRVHWKPDIHGGLYFIRKGALCDAIYKDCQNIVAHYSDFRWPDYCAPYADEPILCLAMAANGVHALDADPRNYGIPWEVTQMDVDIFSGRCTYATEWHPLVAQGRMIHWSVRYCQKPLYIFEAEKVNLLVKNGMRPGKEGVCLNGKDTILYQWKLRYYFLLICSFSRRAINKVCRVLKISRFFAE